jgi:hypothetical protein
MIDGSAPDSTAFIELAQYSAFPDLCSLRPEIAYTFRSGTCRKVVTQQPIRLYRLWGGTSREFGAFWTTARPHGGLQQTIDCAILPDWGNTLTNLTRIVVPAGVTIYEGYAAPQGGLVGGCVQIFLEGVNPSWKVR